jgi:NADP-dependent 3-hydroxy acid dehydrogenase YdfG
MSFSDYRTALVTGASAGMGAAIVERFCKEGLMVHAVARRQDRLKELAGRTGCIPHAMDMTNIDAVTELLSRLEIDVLVNNAGVGRTGNITGASADDINELIDLNLRSVLHTVRMLLPGMMERDRGHIINISSIAGHYNFGGNTMYHATKAAIHMLSQQLRVDVLGKRIRITEICPGRVETEIFDRNHGVSKEEARKKFYEGYEVPSAAHIADIAAFAISVPSYVNLGLIEVMSTFQVPGGLTTLKSKE